VGAERAPELAEFIRKALDARLAHVNVSLPGRIEKYDAGQQKADVKPLIMTAFDDESDDRQVLSIPIITNVPVAFPQGGGYSLTFPLAAGDLGLIVWSNLSLDRWLAGQGQEVDPEVDHLHQLSDGIFIPGIRPFGSALRGVPDDHAAIGATDGIRIHLRGDSICIGDEDGSDNLALANKVKLELQALASAAGAGTYVYGTASGGGVDASQAKGK